MLMVMDSRCEPMQCRAQGEVVVKRSAFGMQSWTHAVGDRVTIRVAIVAREIAEPGKANGAAPVTNTVAAPSADLPQKQTPP